MDELPAAVTDELLESLALPLRTALTHLRLDRCSLLTDRGLRALGLGAPSPVLMSLSLESCWRVTDEGVLAVALPCASSLTHLNLGDTKVGSNRRLYNVLA